MMKMRQLIRQLLSKDTEERLSAIETLKRNPDRIRRNQHNFYELMSNLVFILFAEKDQTIRNEVLCVMDEIDPDLSQHYREREDRKQRHQLESKKAIAYCERFRGRPDDAQRFVKTWLEQGADEGEFANPFLLAMFVEMTHVEPVVITELVAGLKSCPHLIVTLTEILTEVAPDHPELDAALIPMVGDENLGVRIAAVKILGEMGRRAEKTVYGLISRLRECQDEEEFDALAEAIGQLGANSEEWLEVIASNLQHTTDKRVRDAFALALCHAAEENAPPALELIEQLLDHHDTEIRRAVSHAVVEVYSALSNLRAIFPKMINDPNQIIRRKAARALEDESMMSLRRSTADFVPLLRSDDQVLRRIGLRSIGRMGSEAHAATPHILRLLKDSARSVRLAAVSTLLQMEMATPAEQIQAVLEEAEEFGDFDEQKKAKRLRRALDSSDS